MKYEILIDEEALSDIQEVTECFSLAEKISKTSIR